MSQVHKDLQFVACAFCYKHYRLQPQSHPAIDNERRTGTPPWLQPGRQNRFPMR